MGSLSRIVSLILFAVLPSLGLSQSTQIIATSVNNGGVALTNGQLCLIAVTPTGQTQNFSANGHLYLAGDLAHVQGGFCGAVYGGALAATLAVPDRTAATSAAPLCYEVMFVGQRGQVADLGTRCDITGASVSLNTYVPPATRQFNVTGYTTGASVPASCSLGALFLNTNTNHLYSCGTDSTFHDMAGNGSGTSDYNQLINRPTLSTVATSGNYNDLANKPTIPVLSASTIGVALQGITGCSTPGYVYSPASGTCSAPSSGGTTDYNALTNKPNLASVATSGNYGDLSNKPTIPAALVAGTDYATPTAVTNAVAAERTAAANASNLSSGAVPLPQIPDLSPAGIYVSKKCAGKQVNLNTGLALDGTTATDFGPCINALLAGASPTNPVTVVIDGSFAVSGVYGPLAGYWSLVGLGGGMDGNNNLYGTGLYQVAGTNGDVIHNGSKHNYEPGQPGDPSTVGANVTVRDFVINGNRGNGTNGNNTSGDPRQQAGSGYPWTFGVGLHFLNHVRVSGMYFYNIATFNTVFDNIGDGTFDNNTCANTGANGSVAVGQNGDCWHVEGSSHDLHSSNVTCRSTDDCFALNAPEGPGGLIERVNITNWTMDARTCGRMYTNSSSSSVLVRNVSVSNVNCKSQSWAIMFGQADAPAHTLTVPNSITNVRVSNSTFSGPFGFIISDSIGDLTIANTTVADNTCSHDGLSQPYCGFVQTATNTGITINHLALLNDTSKLTSTGSNAVAGALNTLNGWNSGSGNVNSKSLSITTLDISGFRVIQEGVGYGSIGQLITTDAQTSILKAVLSGNDMSNINALTNYPAAVQYPTAPVIGANFASGTDFYPQNGFVFGMTAASALHFGQVGQMIIVTNSTAGALNLSPASGTTINGGTSAVSIAAGKRQILVVNPSTATDWLLVN